MKDVSDEEYKEYVDYNVVTYKTLRLIARKVMMGNKLTLRETSIFEGRTEEVNKMILKLKKW